MHKRPFLKSLLAGAALATLPCLTAAQAFPGQPVRRVLPFAPGGTTDIVARIVSERMGQAPGQNVVVENKAEPAVDKKVVAQQGLKLD